MAKKNNFTLLAESIGIEPNFFTVAKWKKGTPLEYTSGDLREYVVQLKTFLSNERSKKDGITPDERHTIQREIDSWDSFLNVYKRVKIKDGDVYAKSKKV